MFVLGLTGGIGSGKSAASDILSNEGIKVVDADVLSREPVQRGTDGLKEIEKKFGSKILTDEGQLNRKLLREIIFEDNEAKLWLEALLHPMIGKLIKNEIELSDSKYTLLVSPLLFETMQSNYCDQVLVIDVSKETQILRTTSRDNVSEEQVKAIIESQINREERLSAADFVIKNESSLEKFKQEVLDLHHKILLQIDSK